MRKEETHRMDINMRNASRSVLFTFIMSKSNTYVDEDIQDALVSIYANTTYPPPRHNLVTTLTQTHSPVNYD